MSFEYNGFIHRDLEPQVRYDAEQVELLKQADQKIYETISTLPLGGEKVSLTFPAGASEGTITAEQLAVLQSSEANYIEMVNDKELYYLNDNGHTDGYLTYSHVGIENSKATIKTLTITVSAKSFVIVTTVVPTESGGGKMYLHSLSGSSGDYLYFINSLKEKMSQDRQGLKTTNGFIRGTYTKYSDSNQPIFIITNIDTDKNIHYLNDIKEDTTLSSSFYGETITEL